MSSFHPLKIKDVIRETSQAVSLDFEIPENLRSEFAFKAGQYITVKTQIDGKEIRRSYSLCTPPNSESFKVTVKEVPNGTFSVIANNKLQAGDTLEVHPPEGRFVFEPSAPEKHKLYAAFAAGSGITPVLSILKSVLHSEPKSRFVLVYGNKQPSETIFFMELLELQAKYPDRLFVEFVYSQANEENSLYGRIDQSTVNFILKNKFKGEEFDRFFLCGPEAMINSVSDILVEKGIQKERILFELFNTQEEGSVDIDTDGTTEVTIMLDDEETTLIMPRDKTVLEVALENGIDAPYSCQGGICSSCVARITEGDATMAKNSILVDSEIQEGLVLTCQAHPTTPKLRVDFDDI